ncbi:hypothetical protein Ciccas_005478 [Cichlidogyrus casuarinus]|uniref:RRM domain-containing protein n=1 Tax=Cichlidogyrus casuarinus TaxID=1844966 RepID=A0ABD2Q8I4_9PLAT
MITYHLAFSKDLTKADLTAVLEKFAGYKSLKYIYDRFDGTPKGYAFAKFEQLLSSRPTTIKGCEISWSIAKDVESAWQRRRSEARPRRWFRESTRDDVF